MYGNLLGMIDEDRLINNGSPRLVVVGLEGKGWMSVVTGLIKKDVGWSLRAGQHSA